MDPRDLVFSSHWALARISSAKFAAATMTFDLVNLDAPHRAHELRFVGIGLAAGISGKTLEPAYDTFTTRIAANFPSFDGAEAFFAEIATPVFSGYILNVWRGRSVLDPLATISAGGLSFSKSVSGDGGTRGRLSVHYGNGTPVGTVRNHLHLNIPDPEPPGPRRIAPHEPKKLVIENSLFDFDSATLNARAHGTLTQAMLFLSMRRKPRVIIEGHTDSVGKATYNVDLSRRRAEAVKAWFIAIGFPGADEFGIKALGESQPIAPNKNPDGTDNPAGRQKNRRVEVKWD
jgi:outer membrane protein OmpA-like peptidoglycan-associated protein